MKTMKEKLLNIFKEEFSDIDFELSTALIDDGILDSIVLVELISIISMEFGVSIPYEEIIPENFNSVDAMAQMLERLGA